MTGRWTVVVLVVTTFAVVPGAAGAALAENESPLADAGLDQQAERGESVLLDATGSRDPGGEIVGFEWRIETPDGDVVRPRCTDCPRTRFTADQAGRYAVTATVTDDDGATSSDTLFVDVETDDSGPAGDDRDDEVEGATSGSPSDSGSGVVSGSSAGCTGDCTTEPWIEIHGPSSVGTDEEVSFNVEYGGFSSEPQIGWSISGHGETASERWNSPGDVTIYATGATDSEFARDAHEVEVVENMEPEVSIDTPDSMRPGETITLTADTSDRDGRVVSVEWQNGPRVSVPEQGEEFIRITVTDDDGGTAVRRITITSAGVKSKNTPESKAIHSVYCYYDEKSERTRQSPDHCEIVNSDNSPDSDGHQSDASNVQRMLQSSYYDVIWRKTEQDVNQHSGNLGNGVGTRMPDVVDNDGTSPSVPSLDSSQRSVLRGNSVKTSEESFTMDGNTVTNDLTGNGEINSEDWDERFGSDSSVDVGNRDHAVDEVKKSQRADRQATGSGGPATSDTGANPERKSGPGWHSGTDNSSTSVNDNGGSSTTSGEVAAEKGEKLASGGTGLF